jgi:hypothetical protein
VLQVACMAFGSVLNMLVNSGPVTKKDCSCVSDRDATGVRVRTQTRPPFTTKYARGSMCRTRPQLVSRQPSVYAGVGTSCD